MTDAETDAPLDIRGDILVHVCPLCIYASGSCDSGPKATTKCQDKVV